MNNRQRLHTIMNYEMPDRMPAVHFGFTPEVIQNWVQKGHLSKDILDFEDYSFESEAILSQKLGFDFGWHANRLTTTELFPFFDEKLVEYLDNGFEKHLNADGVFILQKAGTNSIPAEVDHLLKDRNSWKEHYLPRLTFTLERFSVHELTLIKNEQKKGNPVGLHCGSLCGRIRDYLGIVGLSYMFADDVELVEEIFHTVGELCFLSVQKALESGIQFDYAHFWEDMCYKNGSLLSPTMFEEYTAEYYKKITDMLTAHHIKIVSVDCDGMIDQLLPTWISNGVNTMFPIEVGTWAANIAPWRHQFGKQLYGVGGMRKHVLAQNYHEIDMELERLKPMAKQLGYIPCPDHRIPENAVWENVQYYCEQVKKILY